MTTFIVRRLVAAFFIVLGASFIVYMLMANAGDPLAFTAEIAEPDRSARRVIDSVTEALNLDVNPVARYFLWLGDVLQGDFGISARTQQPVIDDLADRVPLTLKLVMAATILSVLIGTAVGIVTALQAVLRLRLHHDVLHVRVLLPAGLLGRRDPQGRRRHQLQRLAARRRPLRAVVHRARRACSPPGSATASPAADLPRRLAFAAVGGARRSTAILIYISATQWLLDPGFGPVVLAIFAAAIAYGVTAVMAGVRNRKALYTALTTAAHRRRARGSRCRRSSTATRMNLWLLLGLGVVADRSSASASATPSAATTRGCRRAPAAVTALLVVGRRSSSTARCSRGTSTRRTRSSAAGRSRRSAIGSRGSRAASGSSPTTRSAT